MLKKLRQIFKNNETTNFSNQFLSIEEIKNNFSEIGIDGTINGKTEQPDMYLIKELFGTERHFTDEDKYEHEILAISKKDNYTCVIESKEKKINDFVDVSIKCKIFFEQKILIEKDIE